MRKLKSTLAKKLIVTFLVVSGLLIFTITLKNEKIVDDYLKLITMIKSKNSGVDLSHKGYRVVMENGYVATDNVSTDPTVDGKNTGSMNLNLIERVSDPYVKELLSIYAQNEEGQLTHHTKTIPVSLLLGLQWTETSYLPDGRYTPKSTLPISNGKVVYNVDYKGISASELTLAKYNYNNFNVTQNGWQPTVPQIEGVHNIGYGESQTFPPNDGNNAQRDVGPFQINRNGFGLSGGNSVTPAKTNGTGTSSGRPSDPYYLADEISYLNNEYEKMCNDYGLDERTGIDTIALMYTMLHNGGVGVLESGGLGVPHPKTSKVLNKSSADFKSSIAQGWSLMATDLRKAYDKYNMQNFPLSNHRPTACFLLADSGYNIAPTLAQHLKTNSNAIAGSLQAYKNIFGQDKTQSDMVKFIDDHTKSAVPDDRYGWTTADIGQNDGSSNGNIWKEYSETSSSYLAGNLPIRVYCNAINLGGAYTMMFNGSWWYGTLLALNGVTNVDPSNPDSYLNSQVNPDGSQPFIQDHGDYMHKYGLTDEMNNHDNGWTENRVKTFNEAALIVSQKKPYEQQRRMSAYGQNDTIPSYDCSFFVIHCVYVGTNQKIGTEIGLGNTDSIYRHPLVKRINEDEKLPMDFVNCRGTGHGTFQHIMFYVRDNGDGTYLMVHAASTASGILFVEKYKPTRLGIHQWHTIDGFN